MTNEMMYIVTVTEIPVIVNYGVPIGMEYCTDRVSYPDCIRAAARGRSAAVERAVADGGDALVSP
jgi:hypothetical protein